MSQNLAVEFRTFNCFNNWWAVYDVYGNDPRLEFDVKLDGKVEFGRLPYLEK